MPPILFIIIFSFYYFVGRSCLCHVLCSFHNCSYSFSLIQNCSCSSLNNSLPWTQLCPLNLWLAWSTKRTWQRHENLIICRSSSKDTDLQNTKTFKDSKHKKHKPKPNPQSLANPEHHMKNQTLHTNIKPTKLKSSFFKSRGRGKESSSWSEPSSEMESS